MDKLGCGNKRWPIVKILKITIQVAMCMKISHAYAKCTSSEEVVFECEWKNTRVSICYEKDKDEWTYKNETANKPDFYFKKSGAEKNGFALSMGGFWGAYINRIRAKNNNFDYYVYDQMVRTSDGSDLSAGVMVYKNGKAVANHECSNDASIHSQAYEKMGKEDFIDLAKPAH